MTLWTLTLLAVAAPSETEAASETDALEEFATESYVTLDALVAALERQAVALEAAPAVRADYEALVAAKQLAQSDALYRDYVRVRMIFEATRDGGLWQLRWRITNRKPNSDEIWAQWDALGRAPHESPPEVTAFAECDELSALFAFLVHKLGVKRVGLFWPVWNHVVAVWSAPAARGGEVRIVVPTSPIFLGPDESLGTDGFNPRKQKTIYEYRRRDIRGDHRIDAALARFMLTAIQAHADKPQAQLQQERNDRDAAMTAALEDDA